MLREALEDAAEAGTSVYDAGGRPGTVEHVGLNSVLVEWSDGRGEMWEDMSDVYATP